jgi:hypothetical protein
MLLGSARNAVSTWIVAGVNQCESDTWCPDSRPGVRLVSIVRASGEGVSDTWEAAI